MRVDERKFNAALAAAGLTRGRFAALLGISRPTLERRTKGLTPWRPREELLICRLLGVDVQWFATCGSELLKELDAGRPGAVDVEGGAA